DVFVRDMQSGVTRLVSATSSGGGGNDSSYHSSVSADGRYVAFYSGASDLVPGKSGGIFLRDLGAP
ncbi:MAG: hypothetical protein QM621_04800, partial [Aeromicrobium sp.]|uniref:hypothetical protein n=1 Tax=Aeromicrobium sp. TaxID=1871063 RepID=UPI0039E61852